MTQSAESIAQKIYGQFHSGKTVPEEIQLITDAIQTERAKAEAQKRDDEKFIAGLEAWQKKTIEVWEEQNNKFRARIASMEARERELQNALRAFCDFHEKNASWDKTGEVYYKAMALLPIRFPSPSLLTKEAS